MFYIGKPTKISIIQGVDCCVSPSWHVFFEKKRINLHLRLVQCLNRFTLNRNEDMFFLVLGEGSGFLFIEVCI